MPKFGPVSRTDLIRFLHSLGFVVPTRVASISSWLRTSFGCVFPIPIEATSARISCEWSFARQASRLTNGVTVHTPTSDDAS